MSFNINRTAWSKPANSLFVLLGNALNEITSSKRGRQVADNFTASSYGAPSLSRDRKMKMQINKKKNTSYRPNAGKKPAF